ncbi:MAG: D-glycero-beta-D-manno-heptose 1,7-bisphosphate 7-phosphatase [Gammaproteobacteria bacterium]|nr:D-glycero-beta-D-manno-heptose 1,7-bisphosphate 7-phosphatase [Gammaproteobacteria bacterium]
MAKKLIILDRDGVINQDSDDFIKSPSEWIPIDGSLEAIARLNHAGYRVVIATNQSGIARELFTLDTLMRIHEKMHCALAGLGGKIEAIFFCPHGPKDHCDCRKPKPGLLHNIANRLHVDLHQTPVIGDSLRDLQAAEAADAQAILVRTGKGKRTLNKLENPDHYPVFDDLASYTNFLINQ